MSALSSALGSIFSATNENYAALANLKFDFSLIKMEAPIEFQGFASALSARRRIEAEEGPSHKTARRLGALFEDLTPSTPKLISAYGLRMSEIMGTSNVNDVGTDQHGPFEPFVGADGTTLWAAATSGVSALGVYLLSCLLARAWDGIVSTAIWVELVAARRKEIENQLRSNHNVSAASIVGAYQDITRKDLALWDSSTRAWLRRADKAKEWSQCQLSLVVKNINIPTPSGPSTYEKVMTVWKRSMLAVEQFLSGKPQEVTDGSVFLAFSAWHLYPDLLVLGAEPTKVEFKDKLIPSAAVCTVGVESRPSEREGVQWALALSHLQYYGEPVEVRSEQECSRLTFSQLQVVAFGGLLGAWRVSPRDFLLVAEWMKLLWSRMGLPEDDAENVNFQFSWLHQLVAGANQILAANDHDNRQNLILLKHGSRRAKCFLAEGSRNPPPFFGLLNSLTMCGLEERLDADSGIAYIRAVARKLGLKACDAVICHAHSISHKNSPGSIQYFELASVEGSKLQPHMRWICPNGETNFAPPQFANVHGQVNTKCEEILPYGRIEYISKLGEKCQLYPTGPNYRGKTDSFTWSNPPRIFWQHESRTAHSMLSYVDAASDTKKTKIEATFHAIIGDWRLGLFLQSERCGGCYPRQSYEEKAKSEMANIEKVSIAISEFKAGELVPERLRDYFCALLCVSEDVHKENILRTPGISFIANAHKAHFDFGKSLYALDTASIIYRSMPSATISLGLIARPLCNSAWFQDLFERWEPLYDGEKAWSTQAPLLSPQRLPLPNRLESFGCIALLDSGTIDIRPEDFQHSFALCSEDTIYVPMIILSDPFITVPEYQMKGITGNISRPGISILVPPFEPRIRALSNSYNVVSHEPYDFKRENNFRGTSLHLSFTDWTFPLTAEDSRTIDHDAQVVEAVMSVRDRGRWVADINILEVDFEGMLRFEPTRCCNEDHNRNDDSDFTSIDSWEELLDEPNTVGIFRAHGNWAARLAAVSILSRNETGDNNFGVLGTEPFCLKCLEEEYEKPGWNMREYESTLPSFCID